MKSYFVQWQPIDSKRWITECFMTREQAKEFINHIKQLNPLVKTKFI